MSIDLYNTELGICIARCRAVNRTSRYLLTKLLNDYDLCGQASPFHLCLPHLIHSHESQSASRLFQKGGEGSSLGIEKFRPIPLTALGNLYGSLLADRCILSQHLLGRFMQSVDIFYGCRICCIKAPRTPIKQVFIRFQHFIIYFALGYNQFDLTY